MSRVREVAAASLKVDWDLYPRQQVDSVHVTQIADAIQAGAELPPIVADLDSGRVVDGFHRLRAHIRLYGASALIRCEFRKFRSEQELFLAAMSFNADHGRPLTLVDRAHCAYLADRLEIATEAVARALNLTRQRIEEVKARVAQPAEESLLRVEPLKPATKHLRGRRLTAEQQKANRKLGGHSQQRILGEAIMLFEATLLDESDEAVMGRARHLKALLDGFFGERAG